MKPAIIFVFLVYFPFSYAFGFGVSGSCNKIAVFNPNNYSINITYNGHVLNLQPDSFGFVNYSRRIMASNGDIRIVRTMPECKKKRHNFNAIIFTILIPTLGFVVYKKLSL